LAGLDGGAAVGADSTKLSCDDGFDLVDHSCEKDTRGGKGELSSFVTQNSIDEVQHLTSNIQTEVTEPRGLKLYRIQQVQGSSWWGSWNLFIDMQTSLHQINHYFSQVVLYGILFRDVMRQRNMKENEEFQGILISLIFRKEKIIRQKMLNLLCRG